MELPARIRLKGRYVRVRESKRPLKGRYAYADISRMEIVISKGLPTRLRRSIVIHEMLHLLCWDMSEEWVDHSSRDIDAALTKLGL